MSERLKTELLPFPCWPVGDLEELEASIADGIERGRVRCHDLVVALDWLSAVRDELRERVQLPTLDELEPVGVDADGQPVWSA